MIEVSIFYYFILFQWVFHKIASVCIPDEIDTSSNFKLKRIEIITLGFSLPPGPLPAQFSSLAATHSIISQVDYTQLY